ncbi:hypothetical protein [Corynebacterium pseudotuberculosis]|uniref:hypothetical protein n=1 Tax=Corynebacterium pseudotuberculosis TaxID=1719 RepID=UPI003BF85338
MGTQAIEASLDIDLDLLRTELCPAPLLFNAQEDCGDALIRKGRYVSQEWLGKNSPL